MSDTLDELVVRLRQKSGSRIVAEERCDKAADTIEALRQALRNVYEVYAGSEGIPVPETAPEAYLLQLVEQMRDAAKEGLK